MNNFHIGNRVMVCEKYSCLWGELGYITQVEGDLVSVRLTGFEDYGDMAFASHELVLA